VELSLSIWLLVLVLAVLDTTLDTLVALGLAVTGAMFLEKTLVGVRALRLLLVLLQGCIS